MSESTTLPAAGRSSEFLLLLPLMASVFVVFLITGAALPALPIYVSTDLNFGTFVVGIVAGVQFATSLVFRFWAGSFSDTRGAKTAVIVGSLAASASGLLYLLSLLLVEQPGVSLAVLIAGRALLGGAESFVITGAQSWALGLAKPNSAGKVIGWVGTALYVGLAAGAPVGSVLFQGFGFVAIGLVTMLIPLVTLAMAMPIKGVLPQPQGPKAFTRVISAVWLPGVGLSFASLGYGAMTAFAVLLFVQRGWEPAWLSFTAFAVALIIARLALGSMPDRLGGARVAMIFVIIQSAGMAMIWASPTALLGFIGAAITGFGYAFVFPGLGREAVKRAPPESRGLAMGVYSCFLDIALGILSPLLGLLAGMTGLGSIFLVSSLLALCTVPIAARLRAPHRLSEHAT